MSNLKKYYIYNTLYAVGFMFCSGAIMQTFLLQAGFSEGQVYAFSSFIQFAQVLMMVVMTFLSGKIRKVKLVTGLSYLSLVVLAGIFLIGASNPAIFSKGYVIAVFIGAGVSYIGLGLYTVLAYCLPYRIIDMKEYGKMTSVGGTVSGVVTFALSFGHTFIVAKFNYMQATAWFFVLAICCFVLSSALCLSLKELPENIEAQPKTQAQPKTDMTAVFKNKNTYILLFPNFARGLATGIMSVMAVIAVCTGTLSATLATSVSIVTQATLLIGSLAYAFACAKISANALLFISTLGVCIALPFCLGLGATAFFIFLCFALFFRNIADIAIPVLVTQIIPQTQIGAYTSIRMLVFTGAQAVATLIITPIVALIGYTGLMLFASLMQFICGAVYYAVAKKSKTQTPTLTPANERF